MNLAECARSELRRDDDSVHFQQNPIFNCHLHMLDPLMLHLFVDLAPAVWLTMHQIFHDVHKDRVFGHISSDFVSITDWHTSQFIDHVDVCVFLGSIGDTLEEHLHSIV